MYKVLNCGTRLELYLEEKYASLVIDVAQSFGIAGQVIGHVEASDKNEVVVKSKHGEFRYS
jgi:phosphoribosylformylglycinamidine cyclo-ligase